MKDLSMRSQVERLVGGGLPAGRRRLHILHLAALLDTIADVLAEHASLAPQLAEDGATTGQSIEDFAGRAERAVRAATIQADVLLLWSELQELWTRLRPEITGCADLTPLQRSDLFAMLQRQFEQVTVLHERSGIAAADDEKPQAEPIEVRLAAFLGKRPMPTPAHLKAAGLTVYLSDQGAALQCDQCALLWPAPQGEAVHRRSSYACANGCNQAGLAGLPYVD